MTHVTTSRTPRDLITALHGTAGYIAHRASDRFPWLEEAFYEQVEFRIDPNASDALGTFRGNAKRIGGRTYHRITIFPTHPSIVYQPPGRRAHALITTITHEIVHLCAHLAGITDTKGRTHTEAFGTIAEQLGLRLERRRRDPIGIRTPGLNSEGFEKLDALLFWLKEQLPPPNTALELQVIAPTALLKRLPSAPVQFNDPTHLYAGCACRAENGQSVVVRVARDYWPQVDHCLSCRTPYMALRGVAEGHAA